MAVDLKFVGYSISTASVLLLGIVAWPDPGELRWKSVLVIVGMATSIGGMMVRFMSHRQDKRDIRRASHDQEPDSA